MKPKNSYVSFLTDEQIYECIKEVFEGYQKKDITFKNFNRNLLDPFHMIFSAKLENLTEEEWVDKEVKRQLDKTLSNLIGSFQEEIIGKAAGFTRYKVGDSEAHSMDIVSDDKKIIADIKNKHNTLKGSSSPGLFQELEGALEFFPEATAYYVRIIDKASQDEIWEFNANGKKYKNDRIHLISGDRFYEIVFGVEDAFYQFVKILPKAIDDFIRIYKFRKKDTDDFKVARELNDIIEENGFDSLYDAIANNTFQPYDHFGLK